MKRDLDLIRQILLTVEEDHDGKQAITSLYISGYSRTTVQYHIRLLAEGDYLDVNQIDTFAGTTYHIQGMTFKGHDYLDTIRDNTVWTQTKERLAQVGNTASLALVKATATEILKALLP